MGQRVLITGSNVASVQAALDLAHFGCEVTLVEESATIGDKVDAALRASFRPALLRAATHPRINLLTGASISHLSGKRGAYHARITEQPRFVDAQGCTACGRCEQECPVKVIPRSGTKEAAHTAIHRPTPGAKSVPSAYVVDKRGVAPCSAACPADINAQGYVALISKGKFREALDLVTESAPFPRVLGRVCSHPCESVCTRGRVDKPVSICALKRFVADNNSTAKSLERAQNGSLKLDGAATVAIIGSGPAGLTAARDLARLGHRSTVFEALPVPGGMITVGMPRFRLPREIRQADIEDIQRLGIDIRTSTPVGKDLTIDDLRRQGFKAILVATGAHKNQKLNIPGEGLSGVIDSIELLQSLNLTGETQSVGSRVVVVGGGYTAIDSARAAVRLHCKRVLLIYRRTLDEMPANTEEVAEAQDEGVQIEYLVAPVRILGQDGRVTGIECVRMGLGEPDRSGRRRPIAIPDSEFTVRADTIIVAAGQRADISFLGEYAGIAEGKKHIVVDPLTMATSIPGIFAAGDAAGEPGTLVQAIAAGRRAAVSIDRFLRGQDLGSGRTLARPEAVKVDLGRMHVPAINRQPMPCLQQHERLGNFEEVDLGFGTEMAVREARRCLNCGGCCQCLECERTCPVKAVNQGQAAGVRELTFDAVLAGSDGDGHAAPGVYRLPAGNDWQASAVAARVMLDLARKDGVDLAQAALPLLKPERHGQAIGQASIGVFICRCGGGISNVVDVDHIAGVLSGMSGIAGAHVVDNACTREGSAEIKRLVTGEGLTHAVVAACACCNTGQICLSCAEKRILCKDQLLSDNRGVYYEFVNIREQCAWVHPGEEATGKAAAIIRAGMARAISGRLADSARAETGRTALVIGEGLASLQCAADLSGLGVRTVLAAGKPRAEPHLQAELARSGSMVLWESDFWGLSSRAGEYQCTFGYNGQRGNIAAGVVVIESSALQNREGDGWITLLSQEAGQMNGAPLTSRLQGVLLCQTVDAPVKAMALGSALAVRAALLLKSDAASVEVAPAMVDGARCRGCGDCVVACQFAAVALDEKELAGVDAGRCRGCGACLAVCPTGAISQDGYSEKQIVASVEALLRA